MQVPDDILHNDALNEAAAVLPANYSFEVDCLLFTSSYNSHSECPFAMMPIMLTPAPAYSIRRTAEVSNNAICTGFWELS